MDMKICEACRKGENFKRVQTVSGYEHYHFSGEFLCEPMVPTSSPYLSERYRSTALDKYSITESTNC